ncbi:MAG: nodulation protein NfeD [Bryobacterales bacterium]|nr:nodulation protein NfeD [Bryobacterales bacterium]
MRRLKLIAGLIVLAGALTAGPKVVAVDVDHPIHSITAETIQHAIEEASRQKAGILLMRLNTPGGALEATRHIVEKMIASPVPVAAYVTPSGGRAASAGFFLLEASDVAAMAPATNTGAASPVMLGQEMDKTMRQKVENDAAAWIRSLAAKHGRNGELAQKAVYEAVAFTEKEALDSRLIEIIAKDDQDLMSQLDGRVVTRTDGTKVTLHTRGAEITDYQMTLRERFMSPLGDPNLAFVLLMLGALGLYIEFTHPGLILPGTAGAILVLLGLSGLSMLPINWVGAGLLILALALFVMEGFIASHGILGIGGTVAMVMGAMMLVEGPAELRIHLSTALAVALPFAGITMFLMTLVVKARSRKSVTGVSGMIGSLGVALDEMTPEGKVFVDGAYWNAVSSAPVKQGARVRVTAVDGLTLSVEPVSAQPGGKS